MSSPTLSLDVPTRSLIVGHLDGHGRLIERRRLALGALSSLGAPDDPASDDAALQLAHGIVSRSGGAIPASQVEAVSELILELRHHDWLLTRRASPAPAPQRPPPSRGVGGPRGSAAVGASVPAAQLSALLESLYDEDVACKLAGARAALVLAQQRPLLPELAGHSTLVGVLSRVLRDDGRRSGELASALLSTLCCFSRYLDFQPLLSAHRAGDAAMRTLELEGERFAARRADQQRFEALAALQAVGDSSKEAAFRRADEDSLQQGRRSGEGSGAGAAAPTLVLTPLPAGRLDIGKERLRVGALARRQEGVLVGCVSLLRDLADGDLSVERKLCGRGIVARLLELLQREPAAPLVAGAALAFLRKLSVFEENKDALAQLGAPDTLVSLLQPSRAAEAAGATDAGEGDSAAMVEARASALCLMLNLCFDRALAGELVRVGAVERVSRLLPLSATPAGLPLRAPALRLLYALSHDVEARPSFVRCEALAGLLRLSASLPGPAALPADLAALLVNLAAHPLCAAAALRIATAPSSSAVPGQSAPAAQVSAGYPREHNGHSRELSGLARELSGHARDAPLLKPLLARAARTGDALTLRAVRYMAAHTLAQQADAQDAAAAADEAAFAELVSIERRRERAAAAAHMRAALAGGAAGEPPWDGQAAQPLEEEETDEHGQALAEALVDFGLMPDEPVEYAYLCDGLWAPHIRDLVRLAVGAAPAGGELFAEALLALACLSPRDLAGGTATWSALLRDGALHDALCHALAARPGAFGVRAAGAALLAAAALEESAVAVIAASEALIPRLTALLADRRAEPHALLMACCAVGRLLHHAPTRAAIAARDDGALPRALAEVEGTAVLPALVAEAADALYLALAALTGERGHGDALVADIRSRRFRLHNREWLGAMPEAEEEEERGEGRAEAASSLSRPWTSEVQPRSAAALAQVPVRTTTTPAAVGPPARGRAVGHGQVG